MPKKIEPMPAVAVARLIKPGKYAVGGVPGLYLEVEKSGSRHWTLRVMVGGQRRHIGLGGLPEVSLASARDKAKSVKYIIEAGSDPVEERQARRRKLAEAARRKITFQEAARRYHAAKKAEFKNEKHSKQWISSLEQNVYPVLGKIPVSDIELAHIVDVLTPLWTTKTETASRLRQRIEAVLSWSTVSGYRKGENVARWKGNLDAILPKPGKVAKVKHHRALPWNKVGGFMAALRKRQGMSARCLEYAILTACRSGEVRHAVWSEIDMEAKVWTIPPERMKAGREHRVPLSDTAINLLKELPRFEGVEYVFPAPRGGALSDMALSMLLRKMKIEAVPHGFRSTFRDWCSENTAFANEVVEMSLAHAIGNKVEKAYRRGDLFGKRRRLMDAWSKFCDTIQAADKAKVVSMRQKESS